MPDLREDPMLLRSVSGRYAREATLLAPADQEPERLCLFLDGEIYLEKMGARQILGELMANKRIPPVASLFVSHLDTESRHYDFPCNERFASFVAGEGCAAAQDRFTSLPTSGHLVCGLSLSGLAAAFLRITYPDRFAGALCQSGSFWWNDEWLTRNLPESGPGAYWISVGERETQDDLEHAPTGMRQRVSQLDSVNRFAAALQAQEGNRVRHHVFDGKHDPEDWKLELAEALEWLLGPRLPT